MEPRMVGKPGRWSDEYRRRLHVAGGLGVGAFIGPTVVAAGGRGAGTGVPGGASHLQGINKTVSGKFCNEIGLRVCPGRHRGASKEELRGATTSAVGTVEPQNRFPADYTCFGQRQYIPSVHRDSLEAL